MDLNFNSVGSALGLLSAGIHLLQGSWVLMKHLKITSTCCGLRNSFEVDIGTPTINSPIITDSKNLSNM